MAFLGIDIGTQSLKAVVTSDDLRTLGRGNVRYAVMHPRPGWVEQDPRLWLAALRPGIAQALEAAGLPPEAIRSVAVCGQLDGCVGIDAGGTPVGPALIWMDRRAPIDDIDPILIRDRAGVVADPSHMAPKIRWRQRHDPDAARVATWHQPVSFVVRALCGENVIDRALASTTMLYGLATRDWDSELIEIFGIDPGSLPALKDAADLAGSLTAAGAELTGLPIGTPIAVGTGDDFSNPLGCGISRPGTVSVSVGTAEAVGALADQPFIDPDLLIETHAFPGGLFYIGNPGWLSGGAVNWFASAFSIEGAKEVSRLAEQAPPGCEGMTFLPTLAGAMTPKWIAGARGAFYGMTPGHGRQHFARAVLEGTAFAMRDIVDRLDAIGVATGTLRVVGGGAKSAVWTQIRADLTGRPVEAMVSDDASALGAAVLAATAVGDWPDCIGASASLNLSLQTVEPNPATRAAYEDAYQRYRTLFVILEPMY